jgi:hypothetical protein
MRYASLFVLLASFTACGDSGAASSDGGSGGTTSGPSMSTSATSGKGAASTGSGDGSAAQKCVDDINAFRATLGLAPYARWTDKESCTDSQAETDGKANSAHSAFGMCTENAQNECPGWPGPPESMIGDCLQLMWNEGPGNFDMHGHYINMSSTQYTKVSCGFHVFPDGSVWAAQDFQ